MDRRGFSPEIREHSMVGGVASSCQCGLAEQNQHIPPSPRLH